MASIQNFALGEDTYPVEDAAAQQLANGTYPGRDLAVAFADEIKAAGNAWAWLKGRAQAANFDGIRIGDWLSSTPTGMVKVNWLVAGLDTYYQCGDQPMGHHVVMIAGAPIAVVGDEWQANADSPGYLKWNLTDTNNGTEEQQYPYLGSNLHKWETEALLPALPAEQQAALMERRDYLEKRYSSSGAASTATGFYWASLGKVWSPCEMEVYGCTVWNTNGACVGINCQLPIFRKSADRINASRVSWWLRSPQGGSASAVCYVDSGGLARAYAASGTWVRPRPCFLVG